MRGLRRVGGSSQNVDQLGGMLGVAEDAILVEVLSGDLGVPARNLHVLSQHHRLQIAPDEGLHMLICFCLAKII
jgi:hypothetical protein